MATPDAGADAGMTAPDPPRIPWLADGVPPIAIAPCPPGWREARDGDVATCDPFPAAGPEACGDGFAHFPGGPGCEAVGSACPAGEWSDALGASGVLYVRAGAAAGGDGTRAAPFARIGEAMSAASVGTIIALSRGRWDEVVRLGQGVTLQGACAEQTVLTLSAATTTPSVVNVTVRGAVLRDLRIEDATRVGVGVTGAAADLTISGVIISGVQGIGIAVESGAHVGAAQLVVRDTRARTSDLVGGQGLVVRAGASVEVARGLFDRNRGFSVYGIGPGTSIRLEDVAVRDTQSEQRAQSAGYGLAMEAGAVVEVARGLFERNREVAISGLDADTRITLGDVVVRDTLSRERDGTMGIGLSLQLGASAGVTRGLFERNRERAVDVETAASLRLEDVVVRQTLSRQSDQTGGQGLAARSGARVEVVRALFEHDRAAALAGAGIDTTVRLEDVVVRDTQSQESDGLFGRGLNAESGASVDLLRGLFERNRDVSAFAHGTDARVTLEDVVVRDTQSRETGHDFGRGLGVQLGARADVLRGRFERNRELGAYAVGADLRLDQVVVRDTLPSECTEGCGARLGGTGVGSYSAATVSMSHFVTERAALCGVQLALDGELDLSDGAVRESMIGACVQVSDYAFSRLSTRVAYVDNGTNIASTDLPLPELSAPVGAP